MQDGTSVSLDTGGTPWQVRLGNLSGLLKSAERWIGDGVGRFGGTRSPPFETSLLAAAGVSPLSTMSEASHLPVPGASTVWTRLALGLVYFHFGYLKFYPDLSSAELLAGEAAMRLTRYTMDARAAVWWIGLLECGIGVGLLLGVCMRTVGALFLLHMLATFLPLFLIPELTFKFAPLAPTLEGQYILKNLVFLAAGWTLFRPYYSKPLPFSIRRATAAGM